MLFFAAAEATAVTAKTVVFNSKILSTKLRNCTAMETNTSNGTKREVHRTLLWLPLTSLFRRLRVGSWGLCVCVSVCVAGRCVSSLVQFTPNSGLPPAVLNILLVLDARTLCEAISFENLRASSSHPGDERLRGTIFEGLHVTMQQLRELLRK